MTYPLLKVKIAYEHDVVLARQRARVIAQLLGFERNDQSRIATAVSEIARNAFQYAGGGEVGFGVEGSQKAQAFAVTVRDTGPGIEDLDAILEGRYRSRTGMGLGIQGARRLVDRFQITSAPGKGTTVTLGRTIPLKAPLVTAEAAGRIAAELARQEPENPFAELQRQNQELINALDELRERQEDLQRLNHELEDTNRGVVALYAELDEKALHLSKANDLKARFLSNMSHEFRTPLNSILSLSRMLLDRLDGELTGEQEKQVTFILNSADALSALVNDLLDIAKIEAGKTTVRPKEFDTANLFSSLRGMLRPLLVAQSVNLIVEESETPVRFHTDEGKVSQILRNLVSNAIKFTPQGEIRVSVQWEAGAPSATFCVADTGIGIAPEDRERIFEEYVQIESLLQAKAKGTGLGLSLSRKLARLLGGDLTVQSTPGKGSAFSAVIPLVYPGAQEARLEPDQPAQQDPTRFPVLVVEDDLAAVTMYEKFLKGSGLQVLPALSLKQARKILQTTRPLAVVLDILMPGEDAWGFLAELRSQEATCRIPVIVATILEDRQQAMTLGADDFCTKPVERKWLLAKLREIGGRGPVENVLVIDDEEVARYVLRSALGDTKYHVLEASGGVEGLAKARQLRPQVIFLDLVMPDMSGFEVLRRLKQDEATRDIPVVIVTSKTLEQEERDYLQEHALAVLSKEQSFRETWLQSVRELLVKIALRNPAGSQNRG